MFDITNPNAGLDPERTATITVSAEQLGAAVDLLGTLNRLTNGSDALRMIARELHWYAVRRRRPLGTTTGPGPLPNPLEGHEAPGEAPILGSRAGTAAPTFTVYLLGDDEAVLLVATGTDDMMPIRDDPPPPISGADSASVGGVASSCRLGHGVCLAQPLRRRPPRWRVPWLNRSECGPSATS
ncbi:hypothetical protein HMPREF0063_10219 [Aeromicrobium marinum DSM 15272]|uniref:Uncharacterized protein n=1 Tax=Aeromicrobium marinum DSM 15272 TaxID=585531 RepID=E2S862_9ACTN|nr:hypothetical protein [Aeromicrobium marinum]EFQ84367.1 hypothetical protein HMPREF0063_10219 [Aeromicrobium marinum DSM 15272]